MFYSQFILAKKGPLGTIWIAAHLERKLRKNQVADTDIGVSVDSIIFPEVPIALRLSSHLLLGVVRIYSRKVNYLFDDCSEALLKVKQAFRSAAVDLPPEESTAPYHSITLPETFDLEDFELPDNEIFQGNYVDHHVSAKEQITLQDTMEGVVYSTSQFGPDERFGDGDSCQIGLDLDEEEALLGKAATPMHDGTYDDDPQASLHPMTPFEADDNNDSHVSNASKTMLENYGGDQVEIHNTKPESSEYAEAPATPMLVEEANLSTVEEALVSDDHLEPEARNIHVEMEVRHSETNGFSEPAPGFLDRALENDSLPSSSCPETEKPVLSSSECPNGIMEVLGSGGGIQNAVDSSEGTSTCIDNQTGTPNTEARPGENAAPSSCSTVSFQPEKQSPAMVDGAVEKVYEVKDHESGSILQKDMQSKFVQGLQACNSNFSHQDKSLVEGDTQFPSADVAKITVCEGQTSEPAPNGIVQARAGELLDQFYNETLKDQSGNDNLDPPAREKLLSVSESCTDKLNNLLLESTPNKEGVEEGTRQISGKKCSLTESAVTMQSNLLESFGLSLSKRTVESIPDDDDLLSSILVGRRSSVLKMKPTPAPLEIISRKRPRTAQRGSASKRKVLVDDTMVLLGDMIRQQLMSTEDLRRMRKKAPCTLPEISMIRRQFLEDEIFSEPTLAGLSAELSYMHKETYDASGTKICELDKAVSPADLKEPSFCSDVTGEREKGVNESLPSRNDGDVQAAETLPQDQNHQDEEYVTGSHITESNVPVAQGRSFDEIDAMDVDEGRAEAANAVSHSVVSELDMQVLIDLVPEGRLDMLGNLVTEPNSMEKEGDAGASHLSHEHTLDEQSLGKDSSETNELAGVCVVSELSAHAVVSEAELPFVIGGSIDEEANFPLGDCVIPSGHQDSGMASAAPEEHDSLILGENNEDAERFGKFSAEALDKVDFQSSSVPEDDFGRTVDHEQNPNCGSLIDDEGAHLHEDLERRDVEGINGLHDPDNTAIGNDTEFLNVDDDEVNEDNEHLSDAEDSQILDNSGWSSRTRAVAKYLQTLFDREAVRGKSILPMDSLLAGKTRKEASRMFFESLVLKTRDYVQVEQGTPFDSINMRPRAKLMKSRF